MAYYLDSTLLFVDFLRTYLDDPKNRVSFNSNNSYTASNETVIKVTGSKNISHITNVQIDGISQQKYKVWFYDPKHNNLVFKSAVTGEVTYDVYTGTNWIYHDRPLRNINDFPRVSIIPISSPSIVLGNDKGKIVTQYRYQINTYCKIQEFYSTEIATGINEQLEGQELSNKINRDIFEVFDTYRDILYPYYSNYTLEVKKAVEGLEDLSKTYSTRQEFTMLQIEET